MFFRRKSRKPAEVAPPPPAPIAVRTPTGEPDIGGLWRAVWAKKKTIVGLTLIAAAGAFVVVNSIAPRYRSEARLLLEQRENIFLRAEADKQNNDRAALDAEAIASQVQLVLSRDLARQITAKEGLAENPEFNGAGSITRTLLGLIGIGRDPAEMSAEERTLETYYDRLYVANIEKSRVISVAFSSSNPELAARIANAISEGYLGLQQSAKQDQTRAAGQWLAGEIAKMREKVADAEAKVEEYRVKSNLYVGSNNTSLPNQQLTEINSQISAARGQKADLEARARQLRELIRSGKPIDSSDIANSESMRRLTDQRTALRSQLAEQSSTLLDQHPRIKELRAQIGELDTQIRNEAERLARQLDNDAKVAGNRLETLTASLDQVKKLASQTNEQDVELRALERESKAQRDLLESYLAKYREAAARDNINAAPPEARIISRATPAIKPDFPKKVPIILIAAFAAFALSAGFTVTGELLSPASYSYAYPSAAYVAAPPLVPAASMARAAPIVAPPPMAAAPVAAAVASSADQIAAQLRQLGEAGRRINVAGTARNVGTTFAAISLARALGIDRNVVLVDLAFNAPNLSVLSSDPQAPGVAELLRGQASFGDIITRDQFSRVHLIATGNVAGEGIALSASPMLPSAVEALLQSYDYVVIDMGAAGESVPQNYAALAPRAVLVSDDGSSPSTRAMRDRLAAAGFVDVMVLRGGAHAAAAA
ncbi:MAG: lipopolysaccharide biosynthesis protein [Pseudolabrys sp.]|nr:lipopolysaccharide biosynthesis protein [Pseudolabrys sp.]